MKSLHEENGHMNSSREVLITLEISVRQDETMLYDEEPSKGRGNTKIGEIRQVHEAINILPRRYHKISSGRRDIFFSVFTFRLCWFDGNKMLH